MITLLEQRKIGDASESVVLEEFINPQVVDGKSKVHRACVVFNPTKPDEVRAVLMCIYHSNSISSHDYGKGGKREDFIDERCYEYEGNAVVAISDATSQELLNETKRHFLRIMQAIHRSVEPDLRDATIEEGYKKGYIGPYNYVKYSDPIGLLMRNLKIPNWHDFIGQWEQSFRVIEHSSLSSVEQSKFMVTDSAKEILHVLLPFCLEEKYTSIINLKGKLKRLLASLMVGGGDEYSKKAFDDFLLLVITPKNIQDFLVRNPAPKGVTIEFPEELFKTYPDSREVDFCPCEKDREELKKISYRLNPTVGGLGISKAAIPGDFYKKPVSSSVADASAALAVRDIAGAGSGVGATAYY